MRPSISIRVGGLTLAAAVAVSTAALYAGRAGSSADDRVSLASVTRGTVTAYVSAAGTTVGDGVYDLGFGAEGTVEKIYVKVGDRVKRGDVLARIDDTIAREEYEAAKAALAAAEETLERVTSAASGGASAAAAAAGGGRNAAAAGAGKAATTTRTGPAGSSTCTAPATPRPAPTGGASDAGASRGGSTGKDGVASPAAQTAGGSGGLRAAGVSLAAYATERPGSGRTGAETRRKTEKTNETRRGEKASPAPSASPAPTPAPTASPPPTASAAPAPARSQAPKAEVSVDPVPAVPSASPSSAVPRPSPSAQCTPQDRSRDGGNDSARQGGAGRDTGNGSARLPSGGAGGRLGGGSAGSGRAALTEAEAKSQVSQAQSTLARAKEALAGVTIKAPADGTVLSIAGTVGSRYTRGTFLTLGDLDDLQVKAMFAESDIRFLKVGQQAEITFPTHPGTTYSGTVAHIDPVPTKSDRLVRYGVTIALGDRPPRLLPGQTATVRVTTGEARDALYVPSRAVRTIDGDKAQVTVVTGGHRATRTVVVGVRGDRYVEIVSGLAEGERVLLPEGTTSGGFPDEGFPGAG